MCKAVDSMLFSGDFTPTTFNLAFFMHSLFRDDIERESRRLKEEREASYAEAVPEDTPTPPVVPAAVAPAATIAAPAPAGLAATRLPLIPPPPRPSPAPRSEPSVAAHPPAAHAHSDSGAGATAKEAAGGFTFHKEEGKKKPTALVAGGIIAAVLLATAVGWLALGRSAPPPV